MQHAGMHRAHVVVENFEIKEAIIMSWDDQQQPWGKPKGASSPEELIAALLKKIKDAFGGGNGDEGGRKSPDSGGPFAGLGKVAIFILVLLLIQIAYSSFYTIKPGERGVVLRFGKRHKTAQPGLNFKLPMIDEVAKVDIKTVRKEEFGFRTRVPGQQTVYQKEGYDSESLMLTADKNVIDVEWIVQYRVRDPFDFLFQVQDVRQAVRDLSEMAIRRIVGNMDFDYILSNREILAGKTAREMQDSLDTYKSGVHIVTVQLQDVNPPDAVKPAFNEVNEADQDMKRLVNEAEEAYNKVIPRARGEAKQVLEEAEGYAVQRVNDSRGDTARFLALLKEYRDAPEVTRQRLYLETIQDILPEASEIYVIDREQGGILPLLDLTASKRNTVKKQTQGGNQ